MVPYQCTTVPSSLYVQTVLYQNFLVRTKKIPGTRAISTLSTEFGPFARLCAMMRTKTNASRVKTRRSAGTRGRDRGLDQVKRLQIGAFCLHHAFSPRATRRGGASSGYRTHVQRQSKCDQRPRPRASADVASSRRTTRDRRDVHASGSTRFSLIEPRFLPCNRNCRSTCFPIEWIDPRVRLSQDSTATTPARTKLVPDVWANSRVPSSYQLVPEFHTICPYINDAVWYSWYAGTYQKISWYGIRPLLELWRSNG